MADNQDKDGPHSLPLARVKAIASLVSDVMPLSPEAQFAFGKAAELFIHNLAKEVYAKHGEQMDYDELASYIQECEELDFLHDFFPRRMSFKEALAKVNSHSNQ